MPFCAKRATITAAMVLSCAVTLVGCGSFSPDPPRIEVIQTISDADTNSLVGLSTGELRQRLGKPNSVTFPRDRTLGDIADLPEECWNYYSKVNHEASGTTLTLNCNVEAGKCVSVKVR